MMSALPSKHLGHNGPHVPAMGLSAFYNNTLDWFNEARFEVLDAAHAAGQVLWDSADVYSNKCGPSIQIRSS